MSVKKRFIPFWMLPASWGLVGVPLQEAKAYYELDGEELARRLIDIRLPENSSSTDHDIAHLNIDLKYGHINEYQYEIDKASTLNSGTVKPEDQLAIDLKYNKIDGWTHDTKLAELNYPKDSLDLQIALLKADFEHNQITKNEYERTIADAKGEPWVGIVDSGFDAEDGPNGLYFELDWNEAWVVHLRQNGYHGTNDDQIIEQWFSDVCRSQAADVPQNDGAPVPFNSGRVNRRQRDDGGTEIS
jgi:hypothetical protein